MNIVDAKGFPVRFSRLKNMGQSAAHYEDSLRHNIDKEEYQFGRAVHSIVLGGTPVIAYPGRRQGKAWVEFREAHAAYEILNAADYDRAHRCADKVMKSSDARALIDWSEHEKQIEWTNIGRACSSRLDMVGHDFVADLKTTRCSKPGRFDKDAIWMHYHGQIAWYQQAAEWLKKRPFPRGYVVAVESARPFNVVVFELTQRALEAGRKQNRLWLEQLLACEAADEWPGYAQTVVALDIPDDSEEMSLTIEGEEVTF